MTTDDDRPDVGLGKAIELRRIELGLKRRELAERARLSYPYISEIENGVKEPSAKALRQIAEALDMKVATLAALSERIEERPPGSPSLLLDRMEVSPPGTAGPPPDGMVEDRSVVHSREPAIASLADQAWETPPRASTRAVSEALAASSDADERIREAVSREINGWLRDVLPVIVRAEVERQLDARLGGDAAAGGEGR